MGAPFIHLSPASCRAARALLRISQTELAAHAEISVSTLRRFENGDGQPSAYAAKQLHAALEHGGILFIGPAKRPTLK